MNTISRNLHATGGHAVQFAFDWRPLGYNLHATGDHSVTRQDTSRKEVCKRPPLHHNNIFLALASQHPRPCFWLFSWIGYLVWKIRWYYGWQSNTEANFACTSGQLHAKPPFFLQTRCENNYKNTKMRTPLKNLRNYEAHVRNKCSPSTLHMARSNLIRRYL
jgi:hypothetical protein